MHKYLILLLLISNIVVGQKEVTFSLEASIFRGNTFAHREDIYQLVNGHPDGLMLSWLMKTHGNKEWHKQYNFPDYGGYFLYQDFHSEPLGKNYAIGGFYNFYFLNRKLQLRISEGIALTTNPYNKVTNSINKAFGTPLLANINLGLNYDNQTLIKPLGFHAGLLFTHYSNGRFKSPNSGINTYVLNVGLTYNFSDESKIKNDTTLVKQNYREPIKYNFVFRTGINESTLINSGQRPFYHIGVYADKRMNRKSGLQLGAELFLTPSFIDFIHYYAVAFPERGVSADTDYKRVGVFVGHELYVNKLSLTAQLGYYVYEPFKQDNVIYDRIGMKYYFSKKIFGEFSIKTHLFLAEALEFGVGYRL